MARCKSSGPWSADALAPTADSGLVRADAGLDPNTPRPGWPCYGLGAIPPAVADKQSAPTAEDILPQIAGVLTPRGPAWGTDEAGDGSGAMPVMRSVWKALAAWVADLNVRDWTLATQAFPSAIVADLSLSDWERELALPDACAKPDQDTPGRIAAVRARFGALGGQSPAYFVCLAQSIGYAITIEEPTQFMVDISEVGPDPLQETWFFIDESEVSQDRVASGPQPPGDGDRIEGFVVTGADALLDELADETVWKHWVVTVKGFEETWFTVDESELSQDRLPGDVIQPPGDGDRLWSGTMAPDLECLMQRHGPKHTVLTFQYLPA